MSNVILLVDDERPVTDLYQRVLGTPDSGLDAGTVLEVRHTGEDALEYLSSHPCAVIVADLKMPGIGGLALIEQARAIDPDAVRMLVTAHADLDVATKAISVGSVFRLMVKPIVPAEFRAAVVAAQRQHKALKAERQLLDQTLKGSVQVLVEILSLVDPVGSAQALRIHRLIVQMSRALSIPDSWELEVAAMLSQLGSLTLSERAGAPVSPAYVGGEIQRSHQRSHVDVAASLLQHIPRMDAVAQIIAAQQSPLQPDDAATPLRARDPIRRGGQFLKVAAAFDNAVTGGMSRAQALAQLRKSPAEFDRAIVESLREADLLEQSYELCEVKLRNLRGGMILQEDLRGASGLLLLKGGQTLTVPMIERLLTFASAEDLTRTVKVLAARI